MNQHRDRLPHNETGPSGPARDAQDAQDAHGVQLDVGAPSLDAHPVSTCAPPGFSSLRAFLQDVYRATNPDAARAEPRARALASNDSDGSNDRSASSSAAAARDSAPETDANATPGEDAASETVASGPAAPPTQETGRSGTYLLERLRSVNTLSIARGVTDRESR